MLECPQVEVFSQFYQLIHFRRSHSCNKERTWLAPDLVSSPPSLSSCRTNVKGSGFSDFSALQDPKSVLRVPMNVMMVLMQLQKRLPPSVPIWVLRVTSFLFAGKSATCWVAKIVRGNYYGQVLSVLIVATVRYILIARKAIRTVPRMSIKNVKTEKVTLHIAKILFPGGRARH